MNMDQLGTDFHATGSVMTPAQLKEYRLKRGECVTCGRRCFQKKLFKMVPITDHGRVLKGRCLSCAPLDSKEVDGGIPAVSRRATPQDLMRFSRSQSNLALQTGSGRSGPPVSQSARVLRPVTSAPASASALNNSNSNKTPRAASSDSLQASNSIAGRGLSVRSGLSSSSADSSRQPEKHERNYSNIPGNASISTSGSVRDRDIPQRVNLASRPVPLTHGNSSVRSASRESLMSNDESLRPVRPPAELTVLEEGYNYRHQVTPRQDYSTETAGHMSNITAMTDFRSDHRNCSLETNHSTHSRHSPVNVLLSTSAHLLMDQKGSMHEGSQHNFYRGDPEPYGEDYGDHSFGGEDDYYYQQDPRGGYDEHHPRQDFDAPIPRGSFSYPEKPHGYHDGPRKYVDHPHDGYDDDVEYRHSSMDQHGKRRLSGASLLSNRSDGGNSRRSAGRYHRHHHHRRTGTDEDESQTNHSETFDEFTSLPSFQFRPTGEEIHDAMTRIKGEDYPAGDLDEGLVAFQHCGPMDRREAVLDMGNQDSYHFERQHSDRSLGNNSSHHGSGHYITARGREPSSRSLRSVNTEEEIAAFESRRSHGVLNRGGAVNLVDMTGGGQKAKDRRFLGRTNFSDHGPSFHSDYNRFGGRSGSYRNLSSRSLDSVSSFGDDHNSLPVTTVERQESMRSLGSHQSRTNSRHPPLDPQLGPSSIQGSNHSLGYGSMSRPPTHNSSSGSRSRNSGSDRKLDAMDVLGHSVTVVGDVGRGVPVNGIDMPTNNSVSTAGSSAESGAYVTPLMQFSRQNSQTSFSRQNSQKSFSRQNSQTSIRSNTEEGMDRLVAAGADFVQMVLIMKAYSSSKTVQTHSLQEISNVQLSPEDCDTLTDVGCIEAIMDAMRNFPNHADLQLCACRALCNISGTQENQFALVDVGAAAWLLENIMESFADVPELQEHAMAALANLAALEDNLTHLIENEIVPRVVQAMSMHGNDIQVQMKGCSVITNLASHPTPMKASVMMAGGGGAVVMAMVIHAKNAQIQEKGLQALRNLSANCEANKVELAHIGGIDASITAMQVHRDDPHVQEAGAWTLCNLAGNMNNKHQIGDSGGVDVIIRAMWVHSEQVAVIEWCVRSLYSLSMHPANCRLIVNVGGISAVVNLMQAHEKSSVVQEMGCAVLCNLANDETAKVRVVDEEALDAIVLAMVLFGDNVKVQERACQVLLQLTIPKNVTAMHASNVVELVQVAAAQFPENCAGPANQLMVILEECSGGYGVNRGPIPVIGGGV